MARLIIKSPYFKGGDSSGENAAGYLRYIATRERVELLPDDRPPTHKQEQFIKKLVRDFPDSKSSTSYAEYMEKPSKYHASEFISSALESHWPEVSQSEAYMKYIATRPRVERLGSHGLFGNEDTVDLEKAMTELSEYPGNIWTHIISLKREDAERLGYDNAKAWRNRLRTHRNEIAAAMNISPADFRWYAAFHDEGRSHEGLVGEAGAGVFKPKRPPQDQVRAHSGYFSRRTAAPLRAKEFVKRRADMAGPQGNPKTDKAYALGVL